MFVYGGAILMEGYNPLKPDIDTWFSKKYDEEKFNSIFEGMDTTMVIRLIGQPIDKSRYEEPNQYWYFTGDGKAWPDDFAWLGRELLIDKNGKVSKVIRSVHYD